MNHSREVIRIDGLRKTFKLGFWRKSVEALTSIDLTVREGDLYGFIGPNGAGKSTTIKVLLGLLKATSGTATLMGRSAGDPSGRMEVGFLPEQPYFYDYLSGHEMLRFYGALQGLTGKTLIKRVEETAEMVGLQPEALSRGLRTYSKGMLQRLGLAQALLPKPRLVLLDEPMSGLDPLGRREIRELLKLLHSQGVTIFYSSHVLSDVEAICTGVAMIVKGRIRRQGSVDDVIGNDQARYRIALKEKGLTVFPGKDFPNARMEGDYIVCDTEKDKAESIRWALDNGYTIRTVEEIRPSLEDVLSREVLKS